MLIALPTRDGKIDDHFGHCDHYTVVTVENGKVVATDTLASLRAAVASPTLHQPWQEWGFAYS